jgi:CheY-like chemotaxis protein
VQVASPGEGHGATFTVRLPREGTSNEFVPAAKMADVDNSITHYSPALRNLRVVIVDDQPEILVSLHNILAPCGAIVQTCLTAQEALEAIRTGQPDVLISDIGMPSRDGYWLIQEVRELPPDMGGAIPALALTAYTRVEERIQVLAHGYQLYISKPVDPAELRDLVARLAQMSGESSQ